ncbi:MAG: hypothetical protein K0S08_560 [Gammaproteobacteria bacterium]|jgi:uncharacterized membrane protein YeiH|nr:hypothetical protein [Gammaproteobacteria bacterium]
MNLITIINWIGTLAFAISGAFVGVKKRFDLLGIIVLGAVTAVGGGATRDIIVSHIPMVFQNEALLWGIIIVSSLTMYFSEGLKKFELLLIYCDAMGLALFSVLGAQVGISVHFHLLGVTFLGALSGAGGGLIRDLLSNEVPVIFLPGEIYATAAAAGAAVFYLLYPYSPDSALLIGAGVTFAIRIISLHRKWSLPAAGY